MSRNGTIIELKDGREITINILKGINVIVMNEMKAIIDVHQCTPSYSWEWLADKLLECNGMNREDLKDYIEYMKKVKQSFHIVKSPRYSGFNPNIDTYKHDNLGPRVCKLSVSTPEEVRKKITRQKKERKFNELRTFNERLGEREQQIGYSGKGIDYKEE